MARRGNVGFKNENIISYAGSTPTPPVSSQPFSLSGCYLVLMFELECAVEVHKRETYLKLEDIRWGQQDISWFPPSFSGSKRRARPSHALWTHPSPTLEHTCPLCMRISPTIPDSKSALDGVEVWNLPFLCCLKSASSGNYSEPHFMDPRPLTRWKEVTTLSPIILADSLGREKWHHFGGRSYM